MSTPEDRAAYIAGMRQLLDALEADPELPLPMDGHQTPLTFSLRVGHGRDAVPKIMAALEAALPGDLAVSIDDGSMPTYALRGRVFGSVSIEITAWAGEVAEKRVTGTRTVEDVEWVRLPAGPEATDDDDSPEATS
jgi:hypothetical protein